MLSYNPYNIDDYYKNEVYRKDDYLHPHTRIDGLFQEIITNGIEWWSTDKKWHDEIKREREKSDYPYSIEFMKWVESERITYILNSIYGGDK